jgi:protein-L-isoaspartate(D-aspartate) O-methyltransferase
MIENRLAGIGMTSARTRDRLVQRLREQGITNLAVLDRIRNVPRHIFVDEALASRAYEDTALPIGFSQTISQPYIVASMTQSLELPRWSAVHDDARPRVLDVGTGSGYQAAVLAEMGAEVVSIEREPELAQRAGRVLEELGYQVTVLVGDGSFGAPTQAPFAGIVVAAAAPEVPVPLVEQLLPDGRMLIPIGDRHEQVITLVRPTAEGFTREPLEPAVFVPLLGGHGFSER